MTDVAYNTGDTIPLEAHLPTDDLSEANEVRFRLYDGGEPIIDSPATVIDEQTAAVAYGWQEDETEREGLYTMEWRVEWGVDGPTDAVVETFPKDGRDTIYFYG